MFRLLGIKILNFEVNPNTAMLLQSKRVVIPYISLSTQTSKQAI
jgi:hypothetical protein